MSPRIDGHDEKQIAAALGEAVEKTDKPWLIACRTTIGFGAPTRAGTSKAHGEPLGPEENAGAREKPWMGLCRLSIIPAEISADMARGRRTRRAQRMRSG